MHNLLCHQRASNQVTLHLMWYHVMGQRGTCIEFSRHTTPRTMKLVLPIDILKISSTKHLHCAQLRPIYLAWRRTKTGTRSTTDLTNRVCASSCGGIGYSHRANHDDPVSPANTKSYITAKTAERSWEWDAEFCHTYLLLKHVQLFPKRK
jgi:hypothetical protein